MKRFLNKIFLNKKIKKAIKEYIELMYKLYKEHGGLVSDFIYCPQCGKKMKLEGEWKCIANFCNFTFPEKFKPPDNEELRNFFKTKETEARFNFIDKIFKTSKISF